MNRLKALCHDRPSPILALMPFKEQRRYMKESAVLSLTSSAGWKGCKVNGPSDDWLRDTTFGARIMCSLFEGHHSCLQSSGISAGRVEDLTFDTGMGHQIPNTPKYENVTRK